MHFRFTNVGIFSLSSSQTMLTAISMSAIATNGVVPGRFTVDNGTFLLNRIGLTFPSRILTKNYDENRLAILGSSTRGNNMYHYTST